VLRATVLSIVFAVAVGPNAALLCRVWCDPGAATASGCHHQRSSAEATRLVASNNCDDDDGLNLPALLLARAQATSDSQFTVATLPHTMTTPLSCAAASRHLDASPPRGPSRDIPVLFADLRI
jgi:hypothetical protein